MSSQDLICFTMEGKRMNYLTVNPTIALPFFDLYQNIITSDEPFTDRGNTFGSAPPL